MGEGRLFEKELPHPQAWNLPARLSLPGLCPCLRVPGKSGDTAGRVLPQLASWPRCCWLCLHGQGGTWSSMTHCRRSWENVSAYASSRLWMKPPPQCPGSLCVLSVGGWPPPLQLASTGNRTAACSAQKDARVYVSPCTQTLVWDQYCTCGSKARNDFT